MKTVATLVLTRNDMIDGMSDKHINEVKLSDFKRTSDKHISNVEVYYFDSKRTADKFHLSNLILFIDEQGNSKILKSKF